MKMNLDPIIQEFLLSGENFPKEKYNSLLDSCYALVSQFMRYHNVKSPIRKKIVSGPYRNRGSFDAVGTAKALMHNKSNPLCEKRTKLQNPQNPKVVFLLDAGKSSKDVMSIQLSKLITLIFATFFENGFAKNFMQLEIQDSFSNPSRIKNLREFQNNILQCSFDSNETDFIKVKNYLEEIGFYSGSNPKIIFMITNDFPCFYKRSINGAILYNRNAETSQFPSIIKYIQGRWIDNRKCYLFWVSLRKDNQVECDFSHNREMTDFISKLQRQRILFPIASELLVNSNLDAWNKMIHEMLEILEPIFQ